MRCKSAGRIHFLGQRTDLPRLLAAADIYCQSNDTFLEGVGAVVEAMHEGLPVVTTNTGALAELVEGTCELMLKPGNVPELTAALNRLLQDTALRAKLTEAATIRVNQFSPALQIPRFELTLEGVLSSSVSKLIPHGLLSDGNAVSSSGSA
jgi:glycosyltransferase involved in cell wall biosynthesis